MAKYHDLQNQTVTNSAAEFAAALEPETDYVLMSSVDAWWKIGAAPTAGTDGHFIGAGQPLRIRTGESQKLQIIRDSSDGNASLSKITGPLI